ncbi:unnamed protein product [Phyllotreta striolata]|uniref:Alpha-N-acetylglucosaminidase n=1 Tax=Phyllotreta striolata TaxID=444603 RepID=A0A9N9TJY1_PHYSR|nr:unnamed protein product [Phyllotreta striolata]
MNVLSAAFFATLCLFLRVECFKFEQTLGHIKPKTSPSVQTNSVQQLVERILPEHASKFSINVDPAFLVRGKEAFKVYKNGNSTVNIVGTTGVASATGFHYYLKYFCNAHISWEASQLNLPEELPDVDVTIDMNDRFRYYQNTCTTSYSFVWWDWPQWEKHIDWMAMNSFNFVLAFNGQEAIWERVYRKLNFTQQEIDEHFTGPAFLSWLRMGNMRGWGGPLSSAWHERSIRLQKKILERMRSLGIVPILPAFAGHLPRAITRIFPDVNVTKMENWNRFNDTYCCPYFLDPTDPLFKVVGKMFLEEQIKEFGTDHAYNCDSFNEMDPATADLTYLSDVGKSIFSAMTEADPQAVWVMQGWLFVHSFFFWTPSRVEALLTSVPAGKMIILDLQSEEFPQFARLHQYFGQPYIWCMLHDFGGTLGMFGSASIVNENVIKARNEVNSTMIGTGLTPEGINQNYVMYDLMAESAWRKEPSDLGAWFRNYSIRRYGRVNEDVINAWQILKDSVYNFRGLNLMRGKYAITWTPSLRLNIWTWYNYSDLFDVWDVFVNNSRYFKDSPAFLHDLVDITRQVLQINGDVYYKKLLEAFRKKDYERFYVSSRIFASIFDDLESILATNEAFLLGRWIESAKNCANNSKEKDLFEYNARNQITLWGPQGEIINYANKQWSGVVSKYFKPRWDLFISSMNESLVKNQPFNEGKVRAAVFKQAEEPFTFDRSAFPTEPTGDAVEVAQAIHEKWKFLLRNQNEFDGRLINRQPMLSFI